MNALQRLRAAALLGALTLLALTSTATSAHAGYPYSNLYDCRDRVVFGNTLQFYPNAKFNTPLYRANYRTTLYRSAYNVCPQRFGCPVTLYDSFGRPYVVYQTNYSALLR